jgi:hypothetical protein
VQATLLWSLWQALLTPFADAFTDTGDGGFRELTGASCLGEVPGDLGCAVGPAGALCFAFTATEKARNPPGANPLHRLEDFSRLGA